MKTIFLIVEKKIILKTLQKLKLNQLKLIFHQMTIKDP